MDEDGFVFISGRLKRFFAYADNGIHKKIFSLDIEKVLLRHPAVENCAVVPVPDRKTLEAPVAYVILKNHTADSEAEVQAYGAERLSGGYKPVKYYQFRFKNAALLDDEELQGIQTMIDLLTRERQVSENDTFG